MPAETPATTGPDSRPRRDGTDRTAAPRSPVRPRAEARTHEAPLAGSQRGGLRVGLAELRAEHPGRHDAGLDGPGRERHQQENGGDDRERDDRRPTCRLQGALYSSPTLLCHGEVLPLLSRVAVGQDGPCASNTRPVRFRGRDLRPVLGARTYTLVTTCVTNPMHSADAGPSSSGTPRGATCGQVGEQPHVDMCAPLGTTATLPTS